MLSEKMARLEVEIDEEMAAELRRISAALRPLVSREYDAVMLSKVAEDVAEELRQARAEIECLTNARPRGDTKTRMLDERCPKCGAPLLTGGHTVWCSMVGCDYGIVGEPIPLRGEAQG
jgi:hypothetical protein